MWFADLSPCTYFRVDVPLVAVGWLERGKPYTIGNVDRAIHDALVEMRKHPLPRMTFRGYHHCALCPYAGEAKGCVNLLLPGDGVLYVCPELIVHYMNAHGYAPPEVFCRAVLACPPMRSMQYLKAIASRGGSRLLGNS